jgi:hypothetical protein
VRHDLNDDDELDDAGDGAMFTAAVAACGLIGFVLVGCIAVIVKACQT